jgi:hypothetical protein
MVNCLLKFRCYFNVRLYIEATRPAQLHIEIGALDRSPPKVGRCRLTLSNPR